MIWKSTDYYHDSKRFATNQYMVVIVKSGYGAKDLCPFAVFHQNWNTQQSTSCYWKQGIALEHRMLQYKIIYWRRVKDGSSLMSY